MCAVFLVVAIITGALTHGIRKREKMLRFREKHTETLYDIVKTLVSSTDLQGCIDSVTRRLTTIFDGDFVILIGDTNGQLELKSPYPGSTILSEKELAVAKYCFDNRKTAGWSTDTLPSAEFLYLPLAGSAQTVGILAYRPKIRKKFLQEEENLLMAIGRQLAIAMEREILRQRSLGAERFKHT
jgi:two-component system sensor histidine kinase KdpD